MTSVCFYFQVHQPYRLNRYSFFDIGQSHNYFDDAENERILQRVAEKCYRPMNETLLRVIDRMDGRFSCAFSLSGTVLEQLERWSPETLDSFVRLARTGCVEFLAETSHHSLAFLDGGDEFEAQIKEQIHKVNELFGQVPTTFRNTELVCSNEVARRAEALGFRTILAEGAESILGWRSPHYLYRPEGCERLKLLLRSYRLSDDIAFRFSNRGWAEWPLPADRFAHWLHSVPEEEGPINLFMDYETFGEHQWVDTGIFDFMEHLPEQTLRNPRLRFRTPSQISAEQDPVARLDIPHPVSWADAERDLTAWLGNDMQRSAHAALYELVDPLRCVSETHPELLATWRKLSTSDHVYYMCTKFFSDGDVHKYFSPFDSPHDAFISFMNVLADLRQRIEVARQSEDKTPTLQAV